MGLISNPSAISPADTHYESYGKIRKAEHLQTIHGQTNCAPDERCTDGRGDNRSGEPTATLKRRHFYMKEKNETHGD